MSIRRAFFGLAGLLLLLVFTSLSAWAQFESAIEGTVTDPSGAVVPNATVTAKDVGTGVTRTVQTSSAGNYRIPSLPAHLFTITITAPGFKTTVQENIRLQGNETKSVNVTLELGTTATEVTVSAAPPAIETSEARVSSQINESRVENLPLVARNFYSLVVLTAGIIGLPSGGGQAYAQATADIFNAEYGVSIQANGQRPESNSYLIDSASANGSPRGGVVNINPNADSVQELRVAVNNFSAEYGRNSSSVTNVVTKSGSNDVHGTVGYYYTGNRLTAGNIFQHQTIQRYDGSKDKIPVFRRNEGNWSLGGPIRKDRTFFFGSMDFLRSGAGSTSFASVLTPDFINYMTTNYPNNISTFIMKSFLPVGDRGNVNTTIGGVSKSTCTGSTPISTPIGTLPCNFPVAQDISSSQTIPRNGLQWNIRLDQNWANGKDRLYGNWYRTSRQATFSTSIYPAFTMPEPEYSDYLNINYTHLFSPSLLYEGGVTMTRVRGDVDVSVAHPTIPQVNVPGITSYGMGFSGPTFLQTNGEWRNVLSWNRGRHAFKFGGNFGHDDGWGSGVAFGPEWTRYFYGFNNMYDLALDDPFSESNYGFDPKTGKQYGPSFLPVFQRLGFFAQDEWKAKSNLTITLGLRWEYFFIPYEQHKPKSLFSRLVLGSGSDWNSMISNASIIQASPLASKDLNNFAPRLGIAWDPTGKGKMSVRAGAGIFYDRAAGQFFHDCCTQLPVFGIIQASKNVPAGPQPVFGLGTSTSAPYGYPPMTGITFGLDSHGGLIGAKSGISPWNPNLRTQYSENWFVGLQYAFTNNWTVEGNYVGSSGRKLYQGYDVNRFDGDLLDGTLDRLNPSFASIDYGQSNGKSYYHGANLTVKKRFSRGLDFQAAYTVGKAHDTASSFGTGLNVVDMSNLALNYGLSDFDVRHKIAASFVYDIPGPKRTGFVGKLGGGWQAGAVVILQKGLPYTVRCTNNFASGCDYNADGFNYDFPMEPAFGTFKTGSKQDFLSGIFKASDFPAPSLGQEGNLSRNTYIGPGYANTDFNLVKNTNIPWLWKDEAAKIQFRAEFFNLFNRVNLQNPDGSLTSGTFGRSTSVFPARNIQFGLKLIF
ncbi:MAG: TonB-dependent receptor [Acidobacteriia bacterium]|nr:TonB-dependent receptor [Terriglobia bacterium]